MEETEPSDRQLIKRFQRGDLAAFDQFILRHQDRLTRVAATSLYVNSHVEDAVQEVFLRAYKGLSGFRFGAEPFTWMYRTLKNVCQEMNRKNDHSSNEETVEPKGDNLTPSAGAKLDSDRNAAKIREIITTLPPQQREVVVLRLFEDFSVAQTSRIMGCRPGTVKAHLHKAIINLRKMPQFQTIKEGQDLEEGPKMNENLNDD